MSKLLSPKVLVPVAIVVVVLIIQNLLSLPGVVLPEISIPAEPVFDLFGFPITNTLLLSWLTMLVLVVGIWLITRKIKMVPGRWQSLLEMIIEGFWNLVEGAAGPKWTPKFFPIVMTIFLFVITANWLGLTPLFGGWGVLHHAEEEGHPVVWAGDSHSLGILVKGEEQEAGEAAAEEHGDRYILAPMFRAATTDMNVTLALAVVAVALTQYFGLRSLGLVESISEIGKVVSFSFRLFGNIFAGEVLLGVMAFLIPYIVSLPFFGLELFVGLVQALVFMMLSVAFFVVAVSGHGEGH